MIKPNVIQTCAAALLALCLAGCGGGLDVTLGGTISGLTTGTTVVLQNNGSDTLTLAGNGSFTFPKTLDSGVSYNVTVLTQPAGETCTVGGGSGTIASPAVTVTNVTVSCTPSSLLVGTVALLRAGTSVTLTNTANGTVQMLAVASPGGSFSFPGVTSGSYAITVSVPPIGGTCTVTAGTGTIVANTQTAVLVTCN